MSGEVVEPSHVAFIRLDPMSLPAATSSLLPPWRGRGGGELGRYWYQDGKLMAKNNSFNDLAAAADFLIKVCAFVSEELDLIGGKAHPQVPSNQSVLAILSQQAKYTSADKISAWGRSAGGLTVAATINRRANLFKASAEIGAGAPALHSVMFYVYPVDDTMSSLILAKCDCLCMQAAILDVPFVDVVTTMSGVSTILRLCMDRQRLCRQVMTFPACVLACFEDPSLPLTVIEVEEWGCCDATTSQAAYENVLSFSPLDNVAAQPYPHLLLTGGELICCSPLPGFVVGTRAAVSCAG